MILFRGEDLVGVEYVTQFSPNYLSVLTLRNAGLPIGYSKLVALEVILQHNLTALELWCR